MNLCQQLAQHLANNFEECYRTRYEYNKETGKEYCFNEPQVNKMAELIQDFYNNSSLFNA